MSQKQQEPNEDRTTTYEDPSRVPGYNDIVTDAVREKAKQHIDLLIDVLLKYGDNAKAALAGTWDRGDDGFQAMLDNATAAMKKIGINPDDLYEEDEECTTEA